MVPYPKEELRYNSRHRKTIEHMESDASTELNPNPNPIGIERSSIIITRILSTTLRFPGHPNDPPIMNMRRIIQV